MTITAAQKNFWMNPAPINSAIARGFKASAVIAKNDAAARRHNKSKTGVTMPVLKDNFALIKGTGLAMVFERGRRGGYPIYPTGVSGLRRSFRGGSETFKVRGTTGGLQRQFLGGPFLEHPLAGTVGGPMHAFPFLGPAADHWANGGLHASTRASCSAAGFSALKMVGL